MARLIDALEQVFLPNGLLDFYETGGSTVRKTTYADAEQTIANANPVVLNGDGRVPNVFGSGVYRVVLRTAAGAQILQRDPVGGDTSLAFGADWISTYLYGISDAVRDDGRYWESSTANNIGNTPSTDGGANWSELDLRITGWVETYAQLDAIPVQTTGAVITVTGEGISGQFVVEDGAHTANVGTIRDFTNAVGNQYLRRLDDGALNVKWFGAVGDGVADDTSAILASIRSGITTYFPDGEYMVSSSINLSSLTNSTITGSSKGTVKIKCSPSAVFSGPALNFLSFTDIKFKNITVDQNSNSSFDALHPVVKFTLCDELVFECNGVINHSYIGLSVESCTNFRVDDNLIVKTVQANTVNYGINVSSSISASSVGYVRRNHVENSGIGVIGTDIEISGNKCLRTQYGAGIATFGTVGGGTFYGRYIVRDNECSLANGRDTDGFMCSGMEIAGAYSKIQNNTVFGNDGEGIRLFSWQSICSGNIVYNNGAGLDGTFTQAGIAAFWSAADPIYSANYSLITDNKCFDTGAGTQLYGYAEQSTALTGLTVSNNDFSFNATDEFLLLATSGNSYESNKWVSYTPTASSSSGSIVSSSCNGSFIRKGNIVSVRVECTVTDNGTGAGSVSITLPILASSLGKFTLLGREDALTGKALVGVVISGSGSIVVTDYNSAYPVATGAKIIISGEYGI